MSIKVKRVLVQGTVNFVVSCNELKGLVTPEIANDTRQLEAWLEDKAIKMIENAEVDVEIDFDKTVNISQETANELTNEIIGDDDWKKIINENKQNE